MRKFYTSASAILATTLLISCGGGGNTTSSDVQNNATDTVCVSDTTPKNTVLAPEMTISISDKEPCGGGSFILTITGGTPFKSGDPFKVETKQISGEGEIYPHKFKKKSDKEYTIEIGATGVNEYDEPNKQQLTVTDADGNKKTIDFAVYNCP